MYIHPITVEFEDIDSYGIAHHTKIIAYLERARVHFFADNQIDINNLQYGLVITRLTTEYKQPLLMLDKVNVEVRIKSIDRIKFEWDYTIIKNNKIAVHANIEQVVIDLKTKRIVSIPDEIKGLFETILIK